MNMKQTIFRTGLALLIAVAITACQLATLPDGSAVTVAADPSLGPVADLPDDQVADVARGGAFAFESYVSVDLDITVELVAAAELAGTELAATQIIATVTDPDDDVLLRAAARDASINAAFGVATATPYVTLTLSGVGFHERSVVIEDPAEYASISRTMAVSQMSAVASRAQGLLDSDGDGVPDIYDAYPGDGTIAFETTFPAGVADVFTVAFEDNFPNLGDGDYNDFVADYNVTVRGLNDQIFVLFGDATALAKVAGYDHEFGLMFRIPGASGTFSTELNGEPVLSTVPFTDDIRVPLFDSTSAATQNGTATASFRIVFNRGEQGVPLSAMPAAPFDPYLYIKNTDYDVHLIGQSPLPGSRVADDEDYRDAAGFPRALLVPASFMPPKETTSILEAYPEFGLWVDAEGGLDPDGNATADWYFSPNPDLVMSITP
jgi:LruC domain-containing protein